MPISDQQLKLYFQNFDRQLSKTARKLSPDNVHHLRTQSRRMEALLGSCVEDLSGNQKKLLKLFSRLRKKAGRIRDLDVQIAALQSLQLGKELNGKAKLMRSLASERTVRQRKIAKFLSNGALDEIRRRLKRAVPTNVQVDPLEIAIARLSRLPSNTVKINEKNLHQFRILGKRSRYLAELATGDPRAEHLVMTLKRMQDAIGSWHDWLTLTQRAQDLLPAPEDSPLVAALRRVTVEKFGAAVNVLNETRAEVSGIAASAKRPSRKSPTPAARAASAA